MYSGNTKVDDLLANPTHPLQQVNPSLPIMNQNEVLPSQPSQFSESSQPSIEDVYNQQSDQEISHYPATVESLQKELIEVKRVVTVFGNYLKKVEHVLGFHNEHIKRLVMKDAESVAKEIGADLNPPKSTEQPVEDSKVLSEFVLPIKELTEENMVPQKTTLLLLYTHTCPHCITMKPIYEKIAPLLLQQGIQVCAINVARQRKAAIEYQVKGVPSLRFIHQSVKHEFKGQRTEPQILEWIYSIVPKSA